MLDFRKYDRTGEEIKPGDVCIWGAKDNIDIVVYRGETRGNSSTGRYGQFETSTGKRSIKYNSVIFAYDPLSERRNKSQQVVSVIKKYYENN